MYNTLYIGLYDGRAVTVSNFVTISKVPVLACLKKAIDPLGVMAIVLLT